MAWVMSAGVIGGMVLAGCTSQHPRTAGGGQAASDAGQAEAKSLLAASSFDPRDPLAISKLHERAVATIEELSKSQDAQVRANSVEAASMAPERMKEIIGHGLEDTNPGVRSVAAMAAGRARLSEFTARMWPLIGDENAYVRSAAIYALIRCGADADRTPLAGMLLKDDSLRVRSHVAFLLGELGDKSALALLREAVRQKQAGANPVQLKIFELQAAEAMIKLGDRGQCGVLQAALHPSHAEEMETLALAAQLIGEVHDGTAAAQLVSLADYRETDPKHPNRKTDRTYPPEIRLAAAGALASLGITGTGPVSIADEYVTNPSAPVRAQVAYVYGRIGGSEQLGKLDTMMGDPEAIVRVAAAAAVLRTREGQ
jgi:HEAT repeat protein